MVGNSSRVFLQSEEEMSDKMKVGAVRASAIAAANAVIRHLNLGLFASEFEINDYCTRGIIQNRTCAGVRIEGRTNTNRCFKLSANVVFLQAGDVLGRSFPIERVFVWMNVPSSGCDSSCFECYFDFGEELRVNEVNELPMYLPS